MRAVLLCLLLSLAGALPARAEDEPPAAPKGHDAELRAQVAQWLADLGADDFQKREAARTGLTRKGLLARDLLEAHKDDEDAEVRRTVRAILQRAPPAATTAPAALTPGDFGRLGLLTLDLEDVSLTEALAKLGGFVGARLTPAAGLGARRTPLKAQAAPFYDALDLLLRAHALRMAAPFDRSGRAEVVAANPSVAPVPRGADGPMQVTLTEVSATRAFGVDVPLKYAVKLRMEWPPFVQLAQYDTPRVEVAYDPDGKAYKASPAMARKVSYGVGSSAQQHTMTIHVVPAEAGCKPHLGVLEISVPMRLRYDQAQVDLMDTSALPVTLGAGGTKLEPGAFGSVHFEAVAEAEGGRGQYVVEFVARLAKDVEQTTLQAFVLEPDGDLRRLGVYGGRSRSADGTLRITARTYRGSRGKPTALRVTWFRREETGTLRFRLTDIPLR